MTTFFAGRPYLLKNNCNIGGLISGQISKEIMVGFQKGNQKIHATFAHISIKNP